MRKRSMKLARIIIVLCVVWLSFSYMTEVFSGLSGDTIRSITATTQNTHTDTKIGVSVTGTNTKIHNVMVTAIQSLNVRAGADEASGVIATLYNGNMVSLVSPCSGDGTWVMISFNNSDTTQNANMVSGGVCSYGVCPSVYESGFTGWVNSTYLSGKVCGVEK